MGRFHVYNLKSPLFVSRNIRRRIFQKKSEIFVFFHLTNISKKSEIFVFFPVTNISKRIFLSVIHYSRNSSSKNKKIATNNECFEKKRRPASHHPGTTRMVHPKMRKKYSLSVFRQTKTQPNKIRKIKGVVN